MNNRIGIISDSTSYLDETYVKKRNISIVNLTINVGNKSYEDIKEIDNKLLFKHIDNKKSVTTSQPSPEQFLRAFIEKSNEYDEIICFTISSGLSGSYNSACIAKDMYEGDAKIAVVDTLSSAMGIRACIEEIDKFCKMQFLEIVSKLKKFVKESSTYLTIDDLQTLVKTGRIKKTQAIIGNALKVKPLLSLDESGKIYIFEKVRTTKKLLIKLSNIINNSKTDKVYISYAGSVELFNEKVVMLKEKIEKAELIVCNEIGPVLSTHLGKGGIGLFLSKSNS
ncbi:MAG: DegV family protein [Bacilli bacterium]